MYYTGVGSREAPVYILELMTALGKLLASLGYTLRTGDAVGSDSAFGRLVPSDKKIIYTAEDIDYLEKGEEAKELAIEARGSANGLTEYGLKLHGRNVFQVLGPNLDEPSLFLIYYAPPVGRRGVVKGGTNTAVQIAKKHGIKSYNLYYDNVYEMFKKRVDSLNKT